MKITTQMDGDMQSTYATSLLKQEQFPESLKFYFKRKHFKDQQDQLSELQDLVRPRLRIAIVTETWPPEINGVAMSMMQLCQGLQRLGHKILLVRPVQKNVCTEFIQIRNAWCFHNLYRSIQAFNLVGHNISKCLKHLKSLRQMWCIS